MSRYINYRLHAYMLGVDNVMYDIHICIMD